MIDSPVLPCSTVDTTTLYTTKIFLGCFLLANVSFGQSTLEVRTLKEEGKVDMQVDERVNVTFELNDSSGSNKR